MKRRTFFKTTLAGTALLSAFPYELLAGDKRLYPYDRVMLGNTGIEASRVAMGCASRRKVEQCLPVFMNREWI